MNPNIYLNAIVFYRLAQRDQKQKVVPEPEFKPFGLVMGKQSSDMIVCGGTADMTANLARIKQEILGGKINALLEGRFNVSFEDIAAVAPAALRHRLLLNFEGLAEGIATDNIITDLLRTVVK